MWSSLLLSCGVEHAHLPTYSVHQTIVSLCVSMKRMFVRGECRGGPTRSHDYREFVI